jgi:hypothetical protein
VEARLNNNVMEVKKKISEIRRMYDDDPRANTFTLLLLGESGGGKSYFAHTCRKPVLIDQFDPGGAKGLRDYIAKGEIIVDSRWSNEDPKNPSVFRDWENEMKNRERMGLWDHIGTYFLDSATTWSDAIMNQVLKIAGLAGEAPRFTHDYVPQKIKIINWIKYMMKLPCDFILTGHLQKSKDEATGRFIYEFMTTGKASVTIPLLFDEIWIMDPVDKAKGTEYRVLTESSGAKIARSRLSKGGVLDRYETPDMKAILTKVGFPTDDKPLLT